MIYAMKIPPGSVNKAYIYQPETIVVTLIMLSLKAVEPMDPISAMVGFPVKWMSEQGRTYFISLYAKPTFDESGKVVTAYNPETKMHYPVVAENIKDTRIGRTILKRFHSTPYTMFGDQGEYPKTFYYNGKLYSFVFNSVQPIITQVIKEEDIL